MADTDHDGKITSNEWLAMWEAYKKELIEREKAELNKRSFSINREKKVIKKLIQINDET